MNTRNVTNTAFTSYVPTGVELPNGRQLTNTYDALYRRTLVHDQTNGVDVAAWQFVGPSRVAEVKLGNGLIGTWMNNARTNSAVQPAVSNPAWGDQSSDRLGYDGTGRPITKRYLAGGINGSSPYNYLNTSSVVGFTTEYDLARARKRCQEPFFVQFVGRPDLFDQLLFWRRGGRLRRYHVGRVKGDATLLTD